MKVVYEKELYDLYCLVLPIIVLEGCLKHNRPFIYISFFCFLILFICLFFGCVGSSLLCASFL